MTTDRHWTDKRTSADAPPDVAWPGTWAAGWNAAVRASGKSTPPLAWVADDALYAEVARRASHRDASNPPSVLADVPGKVGRDHPETSRRAAAPLRWGTQRYQVLASLSDDPKTAAELAPILNRSRNQTATRVLECREAGYVAAVTDQDGRPMTRPTGPSDEGQVWRITEAGRAARWAALDARSREDD